MDNLFVGNVPTTYMTSDVEALFTPYGPIVSSRHFPPTGKLPGSALIRLPSPEAAAAAIAALHDSPLPDGSGLTLIVRIANQKQPNALRGGGGGGGGSNSSGGYPGGAILGDRFHPYAGRGPAMLSLGMGPALAAPMRMPPATGDNIWIGNLPPSVTEEEVTTLFSAYGTVVSVKLLGDKKGHDTSAALVRMGANTEAAAAIAALHDYKAPGSSVGFVCRLANERQARNDFVMAAPPMMAMAGTGVPAPLPTYDLNIEENSNVYIWGLDHNMDDLWLYRVFAPFGCIASVRSVSDRGYGLVKYLRSAEAAYAIESLNGVQIGSKPLQVSLARAKPQQQGFTPVHLDLTGGTAAGERGQGMLPQGGGFSGKA